VGNPLSNRATAGLENECLELGGFVALDGSSNVIGFQPTASPPTLAGPYTRLKGMQKSIGPAGGIITQPHTSAGVYVFTLDEPWFGALEAWVQLVDQGAVAQLNAGIDVNAGPNQLGGAFPGNNPALAAQTVRVRFRVAAGTLTDPVASTGFFMGLLLKRTGTV
jgi:hypothetical protein